MTHIINRVVGLPEQRFNDNHGERYLSDGRMRCHALAKNKIRQWRLENDDNETPTEELWPECQCLRAAEPGYFVCKWHGGKTPTVVSPPRTMADTLPHELREKFTTLMENPDYISRKDQIVLVVARQWELMEELSETVGSEEAWGMVTEALVALRRGEDVQARYLLEQAVEQTERKKSIWQEVYQSDNVLKELTRTQVQTAKELRQMATTEQIIHLMQNIESVIVSLGKQYIHDPQQRDEFLKSVGQQLGRFALNSDQTIVKQLIGSGD